MSKSTGKLPQKIATDMGEATIGYVHKDASDKVYLCPLCDEQIDNAEAHVIVVPVVTPKLRRHVHIDCVETHIQYNLRIKLHPNEPQAAQYNL